VFSQRYGDPFDGNYEGEDRIVLKTSRLRVLKASRLRDSASCVALRPPAPGRKTCRTAASPRDLTGYPS
jgi:hypothetical protein